MRPLSTALSAAALVLALGGCASLSASTDTTEEDNTDPTELAFDIADPSTEGESIVPQDTSSTTEGQTSSPERVSTESCDWEYQGDDLVGNRGSGLPADTLQVVLFHDGIGSPTLDIGLEGGGSISVGGQAPGGPIDDFGQRIETRQYRLYDCVLDGTFTVGGHEPNGVVDGLGFGLLWRDSGGAYWMVKSRIDKPLPAQFVGMWPLGMSGATFAERTSQITDSYGRESAQATLYGAQLVPNGQYVDPVLAN